MGATLLPRNQEYFDRLKTYVTEAIGVDATATSELLAEIHADLMQAQADGIDAVDYFGQDPKTIGDQLVKNLPHWKRKSWVLYATVAWLLSFFFITWRHISLHGRLVPLGSAAVLAAALPILVLAAMEMFRRGVFHRRKVRDASIVLIVVVQLVLQPLSDLMPKFGRVWVPKPLIIVVGLGLMVLLLGLGMWMGMHSWFIAGMIAIFATLFAVPAIDMLDKLPGLSGQLLIPGLFVGNILLIRIGETLLPNKWQAPETK
ncbi:hypothetical protein [Lacticaseibacillus suibinensis]|uniref:hypothetical protein n=2 Tax=Lacticaseibacillus suibinensis TaxID=2486011 RepID=UPI0019453ACF|nr:hypothetical protein [Lacticaseibacillus suibinensis]